MPADLSGLNSVIGSHLAEFSKPGCFRAGPLRLINR